MTHTLVRRQELDQTMAGTRVEGHRDGKHLEDLKFCRDENKGSCGGLKGGLRIWRYEE